MNQASVFASSSVAAPAAPAPAPGRDPFSFVQRLAADLSQGSSLELPGFPDVVVRIHRAVGDERAAVRDIVRLISSEPALGARLLALANSAAFNTTDRPVGELRNAIRMLGFTMVRSVATNFAMRQLRELAWLRPLRPQLQRIWQESITVAAVAYVSAHRLRMARPDEALTAGLFHQLGKLYILTRAHQEGVALYDGREGEEWLAGVADWHPVITRAILESWGTPLELVEAVEAQNALADSDPAQLPLLVRLLASAKVYGRMLAAGDRASAADRALLAPVCFGHQHFLEMVDPAHGDIAKVRHVLGQ